MPISVQQLGAQARLGMNGLHDPTLTEERYAPLSRQDPPDPRMLMVLVGFAAMFAWERGE